MAAKETPLVSAASVLLEASFRFFELLYITQWIVSPPRSRPYPAKVETDSNLNHDSIYDYLTICFFIFFFLGSGRDRHAPLSHIRVSLTASIGAGHVIFLAGIDATENKVRKVINLT